jgi:hypothetical protein
MPSKEDAAWRRQVKNDLKASLGGNRWQEAAAGLLEAEKKNRVRFYGDDKYGLMNILLVCAEFHLTIPPWAAQALETADALYWSGRLKSWEDIFGKPFPGKRRAGLETRIRQRHVYYAALKRKQEGCPSADLFATVAKDLRMGEYTVRNLYYAQERLHKKWDIKQ